MQPAALFLAALVVLSLPVRAAEMDPASSMGNAGMGLRLPGTRTLQQFDLLGADTRFRYLCSGGLACGPQARAWSREQAGGFRPRLGLAVSQIDLGRATTGYGEAGGLNFSLLLGLPFGERASAHVKLGTTYGVTYTDLPGLALGTGREEGWNRSYGLGMALGISAHWQARLDWDRSRFDFAGGERDVDTTSVGLQYRF